MTTARVIIDPKLSGDWNMAVDQALLKTATETGRISLRFYSWAEPTLSLGYFQKLADRDGHESSRECSIVRRSTGGGAILHDREITYSLCVPSENRWSAENEKLYFLVHEIIVDLLTQRGVEADLFAASPTPKDENPFLCFQRRAVGDVVLQGYKIAGSAQRRNKSALLQHGSLMLSCSKHASELPGIFDLAPGVDRDSFGGTTLVNQWMEQIEKRMQLSFDLEPLNDYEEQTARDICKDVFGSRRWTERR